MARDDRRPRAEDRPAPPGLHRRRAAQLRADRQALNEFVERIREGYAAFNSGDFDAAIEGLHPDVEWIVLDIFPDQGPFHGHDGTRRFWATWREAFDDFQADTQGYVDAGDSVIVMTRMVARRKDMHASLDTPTFAMVWTARDRAIVRIQMVATLEAALDAVGLPADSPVEAF